MPKVITHEVDLHKPFLLNNMNLVGEQPDDTKRAGLELEISDFKEVFADSSLKVTAGAAARAEHIENTIVVCKLFLH